MVEACRQHQNVPIPDDLKADDATALAALRGLVAQASARYWDEGFLVCALAAVAAAKGFDSVAEAVLEMTPEVSEKFMEWAHSR